MDYPWPRVCIPTYERYLTVGGATLRYLHSIGYPRDKILLFTASEEQAALYRQHVPEHLYGQIVTGVLGLVNQRNFITKWLDSGEIFISFDDDVITLKTMNNTNIYWLIADAITKIKTHDYGLASVLPNSDGRRFKTGFTSHLAHCIGSFYICRNNHSLLLDNDPVIQEAKEDIYRTLQYFTVYGRILRYRNAGVQTVYRNPVGGIAAEGRRERDALACLDLIRRYPRFVKHIDKKSGWPDVLLWWRARNIDI